MTLKELILFILQTKPETRDSDKKLIWEVWQQKGYVHEHTECSIWNGHDGYKCDYYHQQNELNISQDDFLNAPSPETIRRCRQALQRSDRLLGKWLIQPSKEVEKHRKELALEKGYSFIQGQSTFV